MSSHSILSLRESFIVRIWRDDENPDTWRGQLQHVRSGEAIPIDDIKNLSAYVEAWVQKNAQQKNGLK